jgi:hypothetical protein
MLLLQIDVMMWGLHLDNVVVVQAVVAVALLLIEDHTLIATINDAVAVEEELEL